MYSERCLKKKTQSLGFKKPLTTYCFICAIHPDEKFIRDALFIEQNMVSLQKRASSVACETEFDLIQEANTGQIKSRAEPRHRLASQT